MKTDQAIIQVFNYWPWANEVPIPDILHISCGYKVS